MIDAFYSGASGLIAYQGNLDAIGHNIANVGTNGFKPVRSDFEDLLYTRMNINNKAGWLTGHGVREASRSLLMRQGNLLQTNGNLDFAIIGDGFFQVERGNGQREFTRNGSFSISAEDGVGYLTTSDGAYVLDGEGERLELDPIRGTQSLNLDGLADRLGVYFFPNPYGLQQVAGSRFLTTPASGVAYSAEDVDTPPHYALQQHSLEQSAVDLSDEMAGMITAQRAYQFNARVVQTADELEELLNNLR